MQRRPCWVEISTHSLEENYRYLQSKAAAQMEVLAVVKANAYGHGLDLCAPAATRAGARWLGVTSVEEGVATRALCPDARILIMGGVFPGQGEAVVEHRLTPSAWEPWQFKELEDAAAASNKTLAVHLEIDTGMSRQGINPAEIAAILQAFCKHPHLHAEAVMTHLFAADESPCAITTTQLATLAEAITTIKAAGLAPEILSVGNSAALLSGQTASIAALAHQHQMKSMLRAGLALYGVVPEYQPEEPTEAAQARQHLKPVLTWKTQVAAIRSIPAGAVVGYNGTFVATEPMRLALLPLGYADGFSRQLSNRFSLLLHGQPAPITGRVSMDQSIIDITEIPDVKPGDEVVLLGTQGNESITAFDHARVASTIPWEIFTSISSRVTRIAAE